MSRLSGAATVLLALGGCGGSHTPGSPDAGVDAGSRFEPTPPALPAAALLTPCPSGWRDVGDGTCDPWPATGHATCPEGEAHFPGEAGCALVGPACPASGPPADLPKGAAVIYVDAAAAAGGDGSVASPFTRIVDAQRVASAGAVIAIAAGTYREAPVIRGGVTLWGACASRTIIEAPTASEVTPIVELLGGDTGLRSLTLTGPRLAIRAQPRSGGTMHLRDVIVSGAHGAIVLAARGASTADGLVVRDAVPNARGWSRGVELQTGSGLELRRAVVEGAIEFGMIVGGVGTAATLRDVAILDTAPNASAGYGHGMRVQEGAVCDAARLVVERSTSMGVSIGNPGSTLTLADAVVRDTQLGLPIDRTASQLALVVENGGVLEVRRTLFERVAGVGVVSLASSVTLEDVVVRDVAGRAEDGLEGRGIQLGLATVASLRRARVERTVTVAVEAFDTDTVVTIEDLDIADIAPDSEGISGRGIMVDQGAVMNVDRMRIARATEIGMLLFDPGSRLIGRDVTILDTASRPTGDLGRALHVQEGSTLTLERARLERNREIAVIVVADSTVELSDVAIVDTLPRACVETSCVGAGGGIGLGAYAGGRLRATRFLVSGASLVGLQVATGGSLDVAHGRVERAPIGVNVQMPGYDLARLSNDVQYIDVDRVIDSSALPVPDAASPL